VLKNWRLVLKNWRLVLKNWRFVSGHRFSDAASAAESVPASAAAERQLDKGMSFSAIRYAAFEVSSHRC
jgi:hypothetical protein